VPQASKSIAHATGLPAYISTGLREGALFLLLAAAVYGLIVLTSYDPTDAGWSYTGEQDVIHNQGGTAGAWLADIFLYLFGYMAYMIPLVLAWSGWRIHQWRGTHPGFMAHVFAPRVTGFILTLTAGCGLGHIHFTFSGQLLPSGGGGILGDLVGNWLVSGFDILGSTLFLLALFLTGITLMTGLSWISLMDEVGRITLALIDRGARLRDLLVGRIERKRREQYIRHEVERVEERPPLRIEPSIKQRTTVSKRVEQERQTRLFKDVTDTELPKVALLDEAPEQKGGYSATALEALSRQVELKLQDFGIQVTVEAVHPGPVVTRFELLPAPGLKVSRITNLTKDLARALSVPSVRVVEVIPGKAVIGLEIPNEQRDLVVLGDIIKSQTYEDAQSPLTLALGSDIAGYPVVADLARMPHLLVAGTTGSGKSVAINAMVLSILYKTSPRDVRMIMVDPKMLELSVYEDIPHLLTPVVTDMKDAANALRWCVAEMERRYRLMAALGVRNIGGFNRKIQESEEKKAPITDPLFSSLEEGDEAPALEQMPYVVVVIDEFADMMMIVGKKVDELIARLSQKARAAGIHLIVATQRPSVDVITGLIKANIPTRIAFQVSSRVDSRTILDQMGAEQLLGHGDMLYLPSGTSVPTRVHGAYVSDDEVHRVVAHLRSSGKPQYLEEVTSDTHEPLPGEKGVSGFANNSDAESDPLYDQAVQIVLESRRASISGVQRRLKIGYNRAARMIEEMERIGIVSPLQSNGSREVLAPAPPPQD